MISHICRGVISKAGSLLSSVSESPHPRRALVCAVNACQIVIAKFLVIYRCNQELTRTAAEINLKFPIQ
jgi:hypothetical protein